jgi:spore coat polysaccharide biosynthesis protein SpsF
MIDSGKVAIIIQARMGSSRLPNKMGLRLGRQTIFEFLVNRLKNARLGVDMVLATTSRAADDDLEKTSGKLGINVFRGNETNVLKRFYDAANRFDIAIIIRICADNIFLAPSEIIRLLQIFKKEKYDYIANATPEGKNLILTGVGLAVEIVTREAIQKGLENKIDRYHKEHVTPYFYENPGLFHTLLSPVEFDIPTDLRLTLDVAEDYENLKQIYREFGAEVDISEVIHFVKEQPILLHRMKEISSAQMKGR